MQRTRTYIPSIIFLFSPVHELALSSFDDFFKNFNQCLFRLRHLREVLQQFLRGSYLGPVEQNIRQKPL